MGFGRLRAGARRSHRRVGQVRGGRPESQLRYYFCWFYCFLKGFCLSRIERSALIAQPASRMFDLVNEVEDYPRLFSWCQAARIESRSETNMRARLDLSYLGFRAGFSTENLLIPGQSIELNLLEGPFKSLRGRWQFQPLGDMGCKVALALDFEFAGSLMGSALAMGFQGLADRLVDDFSRAARNLPKAA